MRIAADRILRNPERRAEHARLGPDLVGIAVHGEQEKPFGVKFAAQGQQGVEIRRELLQIPGIGNRHEQAAAALAGDARGHDVVQLGCGQLQGFGNAQCGLKWQGRLEFRRRLAKFDDCFGAGGSLLDLGADLDDADSAMLPANTQRSPPQGQKHGVCGHGGVTHEGGFLARIEEAQPHIVIRRVGGEHTCHFGV